MTLQVHLHQVSQHGKLPGVKHGRSLGQLDVTRQMFLHPNLNDAVLVAPQNVQQRGQQSLQVRRISMTVDLVTHVQLNAPAFSLKYLRVA